ncbi:hypothetical protein Cthiooxydans_20610 [Comamonas thiooxydans]|uniref:hypothetical protein n=1 Tax=Comamonas thiooxydans TaxID=363952 RepID=UPI001E5E772A|nr:hypothetical protein [Comamonas thiooxydans]BDB69649.1 hypothetical protein Cthiooxydans_20610 [Comamonas thiooxydans]
MALIIKVVGMKAFKGFVNKDGINSGTLFAEVKMDSRHNKQGENFKTGIAMEEWKMPDADSVFRMQHIPVPFLCELEIERVSNGRESKEVVISARPVEHAQPKSATAPAAPAKAAVPA